MSKILQFVNIGVTCLVLLFCIISTSTRHWFEDDDGQLSAGLWNFCNEDDGSKICKSFDDLSYLKSSTKDKLNTTRAFAILAILAFGTSLLCVCLTFVKKPFNIPFLIVTILGVVFQLIALAVYTSLYIVDFEEDNTKYGWSLGLAWTAFAFSLILCGCSIALTIVQKN